jgi:hypothetical protein
MILAAALPATRAAIPNPADVVVDTVGGLAGRGASKIAGETLSLLGGAIMRGLGDACARVAEGVLSFLDSSSGMHLDTGWWAGERARAVLGAVFALSGTLMVGFCLLALIQGLLAGDPTAMVRAVVREVPVSVAATAALFGVTGLLLRLTDAASALVLQGTPGDLGHFFSGVGSAQAASAYGLLGGLVLVIFLLGGLLVWVELLVRSSLLYLLLAFAPLTLAARVWPAARGAFRRLCELGLALVVSKFAIALALALGAVALAGGGPRAEAGVAESAGMSLAGLLGGASLMALAAFTPFVVLRLLPIVEAAVVAQGVSRSPVRAAQGAAQGAYYAQGLQRIAAGSTQPRMSIASAAGGGNASGTGGIGGAPPSGGGGGRPGPRPSSPPPAPRVNGTPPAPPAARPAVVPVGARGLSQGPGPTGPASGRSQ